MPDVKSVASPGGKRARVEQQERTLVSLVHLLAREFPDQHDIYLFAAGTLLLVLVGLVLIPAVVIVDTVFIVIAAVKANRGELYRYPPSIRFIG